MGDLAPIPALGANVAPVRVNTEPQTTIVAAVAGSSDSRGAQARMDTAPQPFRQPVRTDQTDTQTETGLRQRAALDDFTLVGPTPAFQANVLELERDLQRTIDRMEAERSRVEAEAAIKIERAEARADAAEADTTRAQSTDDAAREKDPPRVPAGTAPDQAAFETSERAQTVLPDIDAAVAERPTPA